MRRHHRPIPFPGPIPPGMMRISADIPVEQWESRRSASRSALRLVMLTRCLSW
jgi:hypothetical protein